MGTRLSLCQDLRLLAGIPGNGPLTTINQSGEYGLIVKWIGDAWREIQARHLWDWLWEEATVTISAGTSKTAGTIPAYRYDKDSVRSSTGPLRYLPWADFRLAYPDAVLTAEVPTVWTIRPDKAFAINALPTADLALTVQRYTNPVEMTADADVPGMPAEHHQAIVYKALMLYGNFEEAGIARNTAEVEFRRHMSQLGQTELEDIDFGAPLC